MKISELITSLAQTMARTGDIEVVMEAPNFRGETHLTTVEAVYLHRFLDKPAAMIDWRR